VLLHHLTQLVQQLFYGHLSGTTRVSHYLRAWQSFCTTSLHVLFGLPLALEPSTSYSIHFFTYPISVFFLQHMPISSQPLFCCSTKIISSIPNVSVLFTWDFIFYLNITHPSDHSHLCSLKCHLIFFQARSHFHVAYYFAHNCYTASLS